MNNRNPLYTDIGININEMFELLRNNVHLLSDTQLSALSASIDVELYDRDGEDLLNDELE